MRLKTRVYTVEEKTDQQRMKIEWLEYNCKALSGRLFRLECGIRGHHYLPHGVDVYRSVPYTFRCRDCESFLWLSKEELLADKGKLALWKAAGFVAPKKESKQ